MKRAVIQQFCTRLSKLFSMHGCPYRVPILDYCSLKIHLGPNTSNPFLSPKLTFIKKMFSTFIPVACEARLRHTKSFYSRVQFNVSSVNEITVRLMSLSTIASRQLVLMTAADPFTIASTVSDACYPSKRISAVIVLLLRSASSIKC